MTPWGPGIRAGTAGLTAALAVAASMVLAAGPSAAAGATRYVTTTGSDSGSCTNPGAPCRTIQYAISQAVTDDTIAIGSGTYAESVRITKSLTLAGGGASGPGRTTISGGPTGPSIWVGGVATTSAVTIEDIDVSGNRGERGVWGDVRSDITIVTSVISANALGGVAVGAEAVATIDRSTVDRNSSYGVIVGVFGQATVLQSTVSRSVPAANRILHSDGGGVVVASGALTMEQSTVYGNTAYGVLSEGANVTIKNSTISATASGTIIGPYTAGGLSVSSSASGGRPPAVSGTIIAENSGLPDCAGPVSDGGYNLAGDGSCGWSATGSVNGGFANLGPLADNGGATWTVLPGSGSAAIDAIPVGAAGCTAGAIDQRGVLRPQGPACDIGAVEIQQSSSTSSPPPSSSSASTSPPPSTPPPSSTSATSSPPPTSSSATTSPPPTSTSASTSTSPPTSSIAGSSAASSSHSAHLAGGSTSASPGPLPRTGVDPLTLGIAGALAVCAGGLLLAGSARPRRRH